MKRLAKVLMGTLATAAALALLLTIGAAVLAFSEPGTRFLFTQAERFLPMQTQGVSGALAERLRIGVLRYDLSDQAIEVVNLDLTFSIWTLILSDRLEIQSLQARSVRLLETTPTSPSPPSKLALPSLPLDISLERASLKALELPDGTAFSLDLRAAELTRRQLTAASVRIAMPDVRIEAKLTLANRRSLLVQADVAWSLANGEWSGSGTLNGPVHRAQVNHVVNGPYPMRAQGTADLSIPSAPTADLEVTIDDMELGEASIRQINGAVKGSLDALTLEAQVVVATPYFDPFPTRITAQGPVTSPITYRLSAIPLSGALEAQGHLDWRQEFELALNGRLSDVQVAELRENLTGQLSGDVSLRLQNALLSGALTDIHGELQQRAVAGNTVFRQLEEGWSVDTAELRVGANRLLAAGTLSGSNILATAEIHAPGLTDLGLDLSGDLAGTVKVSGPLDALNGVLKLTSSRFSFAGGAAEALIVEAQAVAGRLESTLSAQRLGYDALDLTELRASANGTYDDFRWAVDAQQGTMNGTLSTQADTLRASIDQATANVFATALALEGPAVVVAAGDSLTIEPFCISLSSGRGCVQEFSSNPDRLASSGHLAAIPLTAFAAWLPFRLTESAFIEGEWGMARENAAWAGGMSLAARNLAIRPEVSEDADDLPIELPDLVVSGELADDQLRVIGDLGDESVAIAVKATVSPVSPEGALGGRITLSASSFDALRTLDQRVRKVAGGASGEIELAGTLRSPTTQGTLRIVDGSVELENPDLALQDLDLALELDGDGHFDLLATAAQEESRVTVSGSGDDLFTPARRFAAQVVGDGLRAEHPTWDIVVSPELGFTYAEQRGHLSGTLTIPKAKVRLNVLPASAPRVSPDVAVVGREDQRNGQAIQMTADVKVILGDAVELKAVGVNAQLTGELRARRDQRERTTLHGTLDVAGGVLSAQGQSLAIESGIVRYDGPVEDPYLDVRAVRTIDNQTPTVKVGIHIRGRADNLTSSIFSEPPMSDTRALSFLILGRDFDESSSQDGNQLMSAAINLGLRSSKNIVSDVRRAVGLDELSAMAESHNSFAIVAGKRIGPSLYVRYTYDTLAALGALLVRYNLNKRFHLEAQSGESSAMDLFYTIEK